MMIDTASLLDKNGNPSSRKLTPEVVSELEKLTPWMKKDTRAAERLYVLSRGWSRYERVCKMCPEPLSWRSWKDGYIGEFCGMACAGAFRSANHIPKARDKEPPLTKEERIARQIETNLSRYGVKWPWMVPGSTNKRVARSAMRLGAEWIEDLRKNGYTPLFTADQYQSSRQLLPVCCDRCSSKFDVQRLLWNGNTKACSTCYTPRASKGQHDLADFVRSLGVDVRLNDRRIFKGKFEIDIFVKERGVAIEYDGLYWHSEKGRPDTKERSYLKWKALREAGVKHLMVFEDEWELKRPIVESRIRNALGVTPRKIAARKCEVQEIGGSTQRAFFIANHLQGSVGCSEALGLYLGDELVAAMSFGRSRFGNKHEWELLRFATKAGTSVVGGASRLFSAWRKKHPTSSIVSFSDNRWGNGEFYRTLGFREDGQTGQGYFYTNTNGHRRSRQTFQKHKLEHQFKVFDSQLSERENCWNNGWYRVWDLGNTRWVIEADDAGS